jgi:hypothetical protein
MRSSYAADVTRISTIVQRTVRKAHDKLVAMGFTGEMPIVGYHTDPNIYACLYWPKTNHLGINTAKALEMPEDWLVSKVRDSMATCGCMRQYDAAQREWSSSQNKARVQLPALALHGDPKWRAMRKLLD